MHSIRRVAFASSLLFAAAVISPLLVQSQDRPSRSAGPLQAPKLCDSWRQSPAAFAPKEGMPRGLAVPRASAPSDCQDLLEANRAPASEAPDVLASVAYPPGALANTDRASLVPASPKSGASSRSFDDPNSARDTALVSYNADLAPARDAVLSILTSENSCSEWYRHFDPELVSTFQSLRFQVENHQASYVLREKNDEGNWIEHGPYIARTSQNTGPGTTIVLNAGGAFFHSQDSLYQLFWHGSPPVDTGNLRDIHVGPYLGASFRARVLAILHELAHVVDAVPADDSSTYGFARSQQNTAEVLRHCKRSIDGLHASSLATRVF